MIKDVKADFVFNSHWHEDHITYNKHFNKICIHEQDSKALESYEEFKRRYGLSDELLSHFIYFEFSKVNVEFKDKDQFKLGKTMVKVIHTPGHSKGHCCFLIDDDNVKVIYLGDIDLTSFGPWYGCLDCNLDDFIESINKVMRIVESENVEIAVSSHREIVRGVENIVGSLKNYLEKIAERENKILNLLINERKIEDLIGKGIIYKRFGEPKEAFEHFEKIMIKQHLDRLMKIGMIDKTYDKYVKL